MYFSMKDLSKNQWNVYVKEDERAIYMCSFPTAEKAESYCDLMNKDAEFVAKIGTILNQGGA